MHFSARTLLLAFVLAPLTMAATCGDGPPPPGDGDGDGDGCFCPEVYDPVCGVDEQTYSNECFAECAGVPVAYPGQCGTQQPSCAAVLCVEGTRCELVNVQCVTTPCYPQPQCVPNDQDVCNGNVCGADEYCCNESCGICAPEGGTCIQQQCEEPQITE